MELYGSSNRIACGSHRSKPLLWDHIFLAPRAAYAADSFCSRARAPSEPLRRLCPARPTNLFNEARQFLKALMIILKRRSAERPIAGRRAFKLPQGMGARLFRHCLPPVFRAWREVAPTAERNFGRSI